MTVMDLDKMEVWVRAKDFAIAIYKEAVPHLPASEKYNLADQLKRSASSIPANIAEGHGRYYYQDNVRFCYIARGSLTETYSHITLACELGYVPVEKHKEITKLVEELLRIVNGYIAYLKRSKIGADEPGANQFVREESSSYSIGYSDDTEPSENQ